MDSGPNRDVLTEDAHRAFSVDDTPRERALCGKADKNHAAIRAPKIVLEVVTHAPAGRHARAGHDDGPTADIVQRDRFGPFPCEVEPGQLQRVMSLAEQPGSFWLQTLRMMPKDLGRRNGHGRIEKHLRRPRQSLLRNALIKNP